MHRLRLVQLVRDLRLVSAKVGMLSISIKIFNPSPNRSVQYPYEDLSL